jgi:hypothetical protein
MPSLWQADSGGLICRWSNPGQRVQFDPSWMQGTSESQGSYLPPPVDFAMHSPFGGVSWFLFHPVDPMRALSSLGG